MTLPTAPYAQQAAAWPITGRHILAHHDNAFVIVYQAYRPEIGRYVVQYGRFGGDNFSWNRMSWIKPNFLWMMYRSGWGTKEGQEVTLALRLRRSFFDEILAAAVPSTWDASLHPTREAWQEAVAGSDVRVQWDPDHDPIGAPLERRALQLGLRGETLRKYGQDEIVEVTDLSDFVAAQRAAARERQFQELVTPVETVYLPADPLACARLRLDTVRS